MFGGKRRNDDRTPGARLVVLVARGLVFGLRFGIGDHRFLVRLLAQSFQLAPNVLGFAAVCRAKAGAIANAADERAQPLHRTREHRHRGTRQRRLTLLQREQRLLERLGGGGDQRKAASPMDAAQRVACAHHRRRRALSRVELQHFELVRQRRQVLERLLDENAEQHGRKRDIADGDFVGLDVAGVELSDTHGIGCNVIELDFVRRSRRNDPGDRLRRCRRFGHCGESLDVRRRADFGQLDQRQRNRGKRFAIGFRLRGGFRFRRRFRCEFEFRHGKRCGLRVRVRGRRARHDVQLRRRRRRRRGGRQHGLATGGQLRLHRRDRGMQRRGVRDDATGGGQFGNPRAEALLRYLDHRQHGRSHDALVLEQPVQDLLDFEGDFAEIGQPDHAAAALQRMELPAHGAQRFAVAMIVGEDAALLGDGVQHLVRLGEIDIEQFGVEPLRIGREQPLRLLGNRGRGRGASGGGDRGDGGRKRRGAAGVEFGDRRGRLRGEIDVADELRIVAQILEPRAELSTRRGVGRRLAHLRDERGQRVAQLGDGRFDGVALVGADRLRCLPEALREQRGDQPLALGALLLDGLDVEAQAGQRFGEKLEVVVRHVRFRIRIRVDLLLAQAEQPLRVGSPRILSAPRIC